MPIVARLCLCYFYTRPISSDVVTANVHRTRNARAMTLRHFGHFNCSLSLGSVVVRALDLRPTGRGFDSRPPHCRVATMGKSFTDMCSTP